MEAKARVARQTVRRPGVANQESSRASNLRAQGLRTRNMIVRAATTLLLLGGGLDFTLRAVARQAKISVSNLQYYFPDRQELLRAVMAPVFENYFVELDRALNSSVPPQEILDALVDRALRDAKDEKTMALTWHCVSLAGVDEECLKMLGEWYVALINGLSKLLLKINPDLGPAGSLQAATVLAAMADGLGYQMRSSTRQDHIRALEAGYRTAAKMLVSGGLKASAQSSSREK